MSPIQNIFEKWKWTVLDICSKDKRGETTIKITLGERLFQRCRISTVVLMQQIISICDWSKTEFNGERQQYKRNRETERYVDLTDSALDSNYKETLRDVTTDEFASRYLRQARQSLNVLELTHCRGRTKLMNRLFMNYWKAKIASIENRTRIRDLKPFVSCIVGKC